MKAVLTVHADYRKLRIPVEDIAYITVDNRKTKITKGDGTVLRTNQSLKDVFAQLPEDRFININRGIVVSKRFIKQEKNGIVTMTDGASFRRRVRADRAPKRPAPKPRQEKHAVCPAETLGQWLDNFPMPLLLMELVYGDGGVDFRIRYLSGEMARLESVTVGEAMDQSVLKLSNVGDPKWMAIFADVAIHGGTRLIEDVLEDSGKYMQLRCFQPQPGYCGCVMTDLTKENNLVQELFRAR